MQTVLVVVTRQIGDVLLATPLIRRVRELWPQAAIDVLGFEGTLGMLDGNADIRNRIATPARPDWAGLRRLTGRLWRRYDLALVADPGDRAHLLAWIAGRCRAGVIPEQSSSNWWKRALLDHAVTSRGDAGDVHVVQERLSLLAPWSAGVAADAPGVVAPPGEALPAELQQALQPGYVVMQAPSMWPYKQWPAAHFAALANLLARDGRQVVLTGSGGAADRACVSEVIAGANTPLVRDAGVLSFRQLASLLSGAALYVGPDTSVSHLAAACGTPVLAIFGPTNPQRWAPWPHADTPITFSRRASTQTIGNVTLLQAALPCVPCTRAGCDDHRMSRTECLPSITPERVAQEALRLLGQ